MLVTRVSYPEDTALVSQGGHNLIKWVAQAQTTILIPDVAQTRWASTFQSIGIRSALAAPIMAGQELVGVIAMSSSELEAFTEEDESLLDILSTQAAVAIQTARSYQALEESRQRSAEAERVAAMGDMASNMIHNINNSVGAIRVLVQQIRQKMVPETLSPDFLSKKLTGIEASAEKTLEMARNIRNPFQIQPTELIDVQACVASALQGLAPLLDSIDLQLNWEHELAPVMATQQLHEVFRNLIKNAVEAMEGIGKLYISGQQIGQTVEITVADTGPGLLNNLTASDIFNLGVGTTTYGLGYGLWWCKIYLNRVGGSIQLDQSYNSGCRFVVKLPVNSVIPSNETNHYM
jgi:signal transduction histidine kinase